MILIEHVEVYGFGHALRNMRNPKESWAKADTRLVGSSVGHWVHFGINAPEGPLIGDQDRTRLSLLTKAGRPHRKTIRTIQVWMDVSPWRGMWQEVDTYKIATVRNSCSTMHKLGHRDLVPEDFQDCDIRPTWLADINEDARLYRESGCKDVDLLMKLKHELPEGFLQRAGYHFNYETALNIFFQRKDHRVPQWRWSGADVQHNMDEIAQGRWPSFCDLLWQLPYFSMLARCDRRWNHPEEE